MNKVFTIIINNYNMTIDNLNITEFKGKYIYTKKYIKLFPSRLVKEDIYINLDESYNYIWFFSDKYGCKSLIKYSNAYVYVIDKPGTDYSCCGEITFYYANTLLDLELNENDNLLIEQTGLYDLIKLFFMTFRFNYTDFVNNKIKDMIYNFTKKKTFLDDNIKIICGYPYHERKINNNEEYFILLEKCNFTFVKLNSKSENCDSKYVYGYILNNILTYSNTLDTLLSGIGQNNLNNIIKNSRNYKQDQCFIKNYLQDTYKELYSDDLDLLIDDIYITTCEFEKFLKDFMYKD